MKKTISINIAGLIFYIEEDGYEKLRSYLNSIQRYFATYGDSKEIISDIEGRIAEKFLKNQKSAEKQVINLEDVDTLIASMGTVADFEAIEEDEDLAQAQKSEVGNQESEVVNGEKSDGYGYEYQYKRGKYEYQYKYDSKTGERQTNYTYNKKPLARDTKRKLLGGVCAGIAHYLNVDSLFVRFVAIVSVIGFPIGWGVFGHDMDNPFQGISGVIVLLYIALWVAFPGSDTLEEDKSIKKFYRDIDNKVLGGVAGGIAAYFGADLGLIRLILVVSLFLGIGFPFYLILWIITPKATTLTEKMEMVGQPITLENIETNVKQALQPDTTEENTLSKLLLLPFRAIAAVFSSLSPLVKFTGSIVRVFAGLILVLIGGVTSISLFVALVSVLTVGMGYWNDTGFHPTMFFLNELPQIAYFFVFLAVAVPMVALFWAGVSILTRQNKFSPAIWQTLLGLFLVGIIGTSIFGAKYGREFNKHGVVEKTQDYSFTNKIVLLDLSGQETYDDDFTGLRLELNGYEQNNIKANLKFDSQGRTRANAEESARNIIYKITQKDSVLVFDNELSIGNKAKFRGQNVKIELYMPYNKPFAMSQKFYNRFWISNKQQHEYDLEKDNTETFNGIRWAMTKDSGLVCLNRKVVIDQNNDNNDNENNSENITYSGLGDDFDEAFSNADGMTKQFNMTDFNKLSIAGNYVVVIKKGDFRLTANGPEQALNETKIEVQNNTLKVESDNKMDGERVRIVIFMPTVKEIDLAGATLSRVSDFDKIEKLEVAISGASKSQINVNTDKLHIELAGASVLELQGRADKLKAQLSGGSFVEAENIKINEAEVIAAGASRINLGEVSNLKSNTSGLSSVNKK
jgi:phage shock protein PspC (stress-responsive transcriptional regulator)